MTFLENIDPEWLSRIEPFADSIRSIQAKIQDENFNPSEENVLRVLKRPLGQIKVVIFGQDPYPTEEHAMGLAFSVPENVTPLPATLKNIFKELQDDLGVDQPSNGDLTPWVDQGVALVNRILTVPRGRSGGHASIGWQPITNEIARILGQRNVIAILWGNYAAQLAHYFNEHYVIASAHPSPLSAYRGFFGSKPFSRTNQLLAEKSLTAIDWSLP